MSSDLQQLQVHILHVEQQLFGSENRELRKRTCYIIVFTRLRILFWSTCSTTC